jgi:hypothetical protein
MARLISVPGLASLVIVSRAREIEDLIDHPALDRAFVGEGRLVNRVLMSALMRQTQNRGEPLDAFRPRDDAARKARQRELFLRLDRYAEKSEWPPAPVTEMARYVVEGRERRGAEAALAFAIAWPFLGLAPGAPSDDAYKPLGRHLWRLHRRTARARRPFSLSALALRLVGADRRARAQILAMVHDEAYGLHAVEITLANAHEILERMRRIMMDGPSGTPLVARELAWAAVRTAPELVVRQSVGEETTLPHIGSRIPPRTVVLLRMRAGLTPDASSGYEFASAHWSACPARRYVMGLFGAVAQTAVDLARGARRP